MMQITAMAPYVLFCFVLIEFRGFLSFEVFKIKAEILQKGTRKREKGRKASGERGWGSATLGKKGGARCVCCCPLERMRVRTRRR